MVPKSSTAKVRGSLCSPSSLERPEKLLLNNVVFSPQTLTLGQLSAVESEWLNRIRTACSYSDEAEPLSLVVNLAPTSTGPAKRLVSFPDPSSVPLTGN